MDDDAYSEEQIEAALVLANFQRTKKALWPGVVAAKKVLAQLPPGVHGRLRVKVAESTNTRAHKPQLNLGRVRERLGEAGYQECLDPPKRTEPTVSVRLRGGGLDG